MLGKEHPSALMGMSNLALVLDSQDSYDVAEQIHRQTLANKPGHQASHQLCEMSNVQRNDHGFDLSNMCSVDEGFALEVEHSTELSVSPGILSRHS